MKNSKSKTMKVSFDVILRNIRTKDEILINTISIPVKFTITKEQLHKIMKDNLKKEAVNE